MKKFFSLVLALVMALSLTTVAWGATPTVVHDETELKAALSATPAQDVIFANDITVTATTIGSRLVGINVPAGVTIDGAGYTLTVDGAYSSAGGTNCAVLFHGGTLKDITIVGGNRCVYMDSVGANVVFENVVLDTEGSYGFNTGISGGETIYTFTATDSVFTGWNSYGPNFASVTFTNCEFIWNDAGTYAVLRPYNDTTVEDCNFAAGAEIHTEELLAGEKIELEDVTVAGEPVTAANAATLLGAQAATSVAVTSVATTSYNVYDANGNLEVANTTYAVTDGSYNVKTETGAVEYVTIDGLAGKFVECAKADADYYVTLVGQSGALMYLAEVPYVNYTVAKAYYNIGTACGQLPGNDAKYDYFTYSDADGVPYYFVETATGATEALMVNGELVFVKTAGTTVPHTWEVKTVNAKHEVTELVCDDCGAVATVYETKLSAPKGAVYYAPYGWISVNGPVADTETDKTVTSADTFDAGIAMYVGMSVMAAAGGAVVIGKKRED